MFLLSTLINKLATASKQPVNFDNCGILCVPFSVIGWLASNTCHPSKIPIHLTLCHLTVTEDTLQSRKHCHCKAGHRSTRGTKTQISVGGCLALGVPTGPEAAGPSQLPTDSQYQGEENSGRLCSSVYPKAIYWAYTMPNTCSEMLCVISRSHPWQDQEADEGVVKQILRNSKERRFQASMLKEDSGRK